MAHRLSEEAEIDLAGIWYYVAKQSGSADIADRLIDSITARFYLLARHPEMGRKRDADLRPGLRSFPVGAYTIIYRMAGADVLIVHVARGSRDLPALFRDD